MDAFLRDVQHAIRMFLKNPEFIVTAVAAVALGIGGTTAIFSVVNTVLLKPIRVPEPERLVALSTGPNGGGAFSGNLHALALRAKILEQSSAWITGSVNYSGGAPAAVRRWRSCPTFERPPITSNAGDCHWYSDEYSPRRRIYQTVLWWRSSVSVCGDAALRATRGCRGARSP